MAVLHVDEVRTAPLGDARRDDEPLDDPANVVVAQQRMVVGETELAVQERMAVQDLRLHAARIRPREASRVRELEARQEIAGRPEFIAMRLEQFRMQRAQSVLGGLLDHQLLRVGAALRRHRHRLAAPHALGPAQRKVAPACAHEVAGTSVLLAIPPLHGMDHEAIAQSLDADVNRLRERRIRRTLHGVLGFDGEAEFGATRPELAHRAQPCDARICHGRRTNQYRAGATDQPSRKVDPTI